MDNFFGPSTAPIPTPMNGTPRRVGRSVTSPLIETGYAQHDRTPDISPNGVEMLFAHDRGRVITFKPIGSASGPNTPQGSPQPDQLERQTIGTLPWTSKTERLIASGEYY